MRGRLSRSMELLVPLTFRVDQKVNVLSIEEGISQFSRRNRASTV